MNGSPVETGEPATIGAGAPMASRYGRYRNQPSVVDLVGGALGGNF